MKVKRLHRYKQQERIVRAHTRMTRAKSEAWNSKNPWESMDFNEFHQTIPNIRVAAIHASKFLVGCSRHSLTQMVEDYEWGEISRAFREIGAPNALKIVTFFSQVSTTKPLVEQILASGILWKEVYDSFSSELVAEIQVFATLQD